jgi:hypothetical protein
VTVNAGITKLEGDGEQREACEEHTLTMIEMEASDWPGKVSGG